MINSSISRCLTKDFEILKTIENGNYELAWGAENDYEYPLVYDNSTESFVNGEPIETDWCTYESGVIEDVRNIRDVDSLLDNSQRTASMKDLSKIGEIIGLDEAEIIQWAKGHLKKAIIRYDKSQSVENFTIRGNNVWLDKETRTGLLLRLQAEHALGKESTTLWYNGISFNMQISDGMRMLYALEVYASQTFDLKECLLSEVDNIETMEGLLEFDKNRKSEYPQQLSF